VSGLPASAQTLGGTRGLVTIPTAEMPEDATVAVGASYVDRRYTGYVNPNYADRPAVLEYASVGFLPFVEVGLRLTRVTGVEGQALGDRTMSARVRLLKEGRHTPAVVVGGQDLVGTRYFHSIYAVASKEVELSPAAGSRVGLHLGYGGNALSIRVRNTQFDGVFGGVSVAPARWISLLAEYDAERVNAGVRLRLWRFTALGAAQKLDGLSAGVTYTQSLR
jgi:hypothetical protein